MRLFVILLLGVLIGSCKPIEIDDYDGTSQVSIMSFNIRYDEPADGENQWRNRKQACLDMINELQPTVFGIQEALDHQVQYFNTNLETYKYVGVGRNDGETYGEYAAIFYDTAKTELQDNGHFWLSETPDYPSRGWDANNIRIVTWAKLLDLENKKTFYVFNTHFDHLGKIAQLESSKLLVSRINQICGENSTVFITGDFNLLIDNDRIAPIREQFFNAQRFALKSDDNKSYNAWGLGIIGRNIDFIFYQNAKALSYKTVVKDYGVPYISDHYPIISHFNYN